MKILGNGMAQMAVIRLAAVVAVGALAYAAAAVLDIDPLGPTLLASLIMLVKLAMTYRTDEFE